MKFPELLYAPSAMDVAKAIILPTRVSQEVSGSFNNTSIFCRFGPVPKDRVLVLTEALVMANPGAAQAVALAGNEIRIVRRDQGVSIFVARLALDSPGAAFAADQTVHLRWTGEVVLMPDEFVETISNFTAVVAANLALAAIHGHLLPRGNWQDAQLVAAATNA